jgi:hypothetical protein
MMPGPDSAASQEREASLSLDTTDGVMCITIINKPTPFQTPATFDPQISHGPSVIAGDIKDEAKDASNLSSAEPVVDTIIVFQSSSLHDGYGFSTSSARVVITGEGSMVAPKGHVRSDMRATDNPPIDGQFYRDRSDISPFTLLAFTYSGNDIPVLNRLVYRCTRQYRELVLVHEPCVQHRQCRQLTPP